MKTSQVIELTEKNVIHIHDLDRPEQVSLIRGPATIVVITEEAAAATTAPEYLNEQQYNQRLREAIDLSNEAECPKCGASYEELHPESEFCAYCATELTSKQSAASRIRP